ncbi:MAG: hypothetical protein IPM54_37145 [Polyangiaceae bacterium]|nr:hypothetical protein [Polyangiaceae bacterium]
MMSTSPYRQRPLKGRDLNEMQRSNLRALLRQMRREHGSWIVIARLLRIRRSTIKAFFDGDEPGNMALARGIAAASELELHTALAGAFVIAKGVRPLRRS